MNIIIAGATGFVGRELVRALQYNHTITVLGRDRVLLQHIFPEIKNCCTWDSLSDLNAQHYDAIINLSGHNIAASRWNDTVKTKIIDSRVNTSTALINWAIKHQAKPHFYCANAIGIYGLQEEEDNRAFDEDYPINFDQPQDFPSEICTRWQQALQPAIDYGMPVIVMRFGVVLKKGEGMLKKLQLSFNLGLGSIVGNGKQILSWVYITDLVHAIQFLLEHPALTGAINITSPCPVSQEKFAKELANAMHRPMFLKTPAFVIRLLFGEMGDNLLLRGQRVVPKRLLEAGFEFQYPQLQDALKEQ